ncbi:MAG: carboxymuconolactone decarboxylase family protein [Hyphomicrobiales bacterium]
MDTNTAGSSVNGASDEKIAAIWDFRESDPFTPAEKAALALAEEMTATPVDVTDETFEEARRWYNEAELVELVGTIAMENYRARFNCAFRVESEHLCERQGITPPPKPPTR